MNSDNTSFYLGIVAGWCIGVIMFAFLLWTFETSTIPYNSGYYEAYKQFKQDKLEQSAPNSIKLRYGIELLEQKYSKEK